MDNFLIIAVTQPYFFKGESKLINSILEDGRADYVHLRKPGSTRKEMEDLLNDISSCHLSKIKLHDHFQLMEKYELGGIHLNSRNSQFRVTTGSVSKSIHSLEEIKSVLDLDYYFISPIFNSISKPGYGCGFDYDSLAHSIKGTNAIALGGVTPDKFMVLKSLGFKGAALLSYFFSENLIN